MPTEKTIQITPADVMAVAKQDTGTIEALTRVVELILETMTTEQLLKMYVEIHGYDVHYRHGEYYGVRFIP